MASVKAPMRDKLAPLQVGIGIQGGACVAGLLFERMLAKCDAAREFGILKIDLANAFNSVRRDKMLEAVSEWAPGLASFAHFCYAGHSNLFWGDRTLASACGVQQGDPLGPLFFDIALHHWVIIPLMKEFDALSVWYHDDGTFCAPVETPHSSCSSPRRTLRRNRYEAECLQV
jgi:hypothetical protein